MIIDKQEIAKKKQHLEYVANELKKDFFGLDTVIDQIIDSIYAWYIFPEIISRPVIINLWGMTGVGKSDLTRKLVSLLGFHDRFVEVQMDGISGGSGYNDDSIASILSDAIDESVPGVLLLDEMQRFRTIDEEKRDIKVDRYQDVWMLLSDGKFAGDPNIFKELEMMTAQSLYDNDYRDTTNKNQAAEDATKNKKKRKNASDDLAQEITVPKYSMFKRKYAIYPYEAKSFKKILHLTEPITEIMTWDKEKVNGMIEHIKTNKISWQIDYSKLLIFISGNLDDAFMGSGNVEDCDTDADFYHEITKKINISKIKEVLSTRFKPEQVSRFGNNHVIYPSLNRSSYQKLIKRTCDTYIKEIEAVTNIKFELSEPSLEVIYNNSVYATQGTRPVFSSIHKIFSGVLVNVACWCLEEDINNVHLDINDNKQNITAIGYTEGKAIQTGDDFNFAISYKEDESKELILPVDLEISNRKKKTTKDFKAIVAVHEAGHAITYALLSGSAPIETKINTVSFKGGYMLPNDEVSDDFMPTKKTIEDKLVVLLAGMVAEEMMFGKEHRSIGCMSDMGKANQSAAMYIRYWGFGNTLSMVTGENSNELYNTDIAPTNEPLENLLQNAKSKVIKLLTENREFYLKIVDTLLKVETIDQDEFIKLATPYVKLSKTSTSYGYHQQYLANKSGTASEQHHQYFNNKDYI
jgi:cell division protease FtsH